MANNLESDEIVVQMLEKSENVTDLQTDNTISVSDDSLIETENEQINSKSIPSSTMNLIKPVKHLQLPLARVMKLMKMDPDVFLVQKDAAFLVTKATEMFIEYLAKESNRQLAGIKRKTITKRDVDVTIETIPHLCFLDGALE